MSINTSGLAARHHRTLLVIDARGGFTGDQKERVNRLLQSVNGVNIKVDVAHLTGDAVASVAPGANPFASAPVKASTGVPTLVSGLPAELKGESVKAEPLSGSILEAVVAAGKAQGYTQVLISATP
jgi:hypothetical protein